MTFEEWLDKADPGLRRFGFSGDVEFARDCWDAAQAAEREACSNIVCEKRTRIHKVYGRRGGTWNMIVAILTQVEESIRARGEKQ